jgi:uncharacterized protein YxjI
MTGVDPVFLRSKFLLRQKHLAISEKYYVWDEGGEDILYIERPAHFLRNLLAGVVTLALLLAGLGGALALGTSLPESALRPVLAGLALVAGIVAAIVAGTACYAKRHTSVYRDDSKRERLLTIEQDLKWTFLTDTYTVKDASGEVLARLVKNRVYDLFRKRWRCHAPDGTLLSLILEDSIVRALLRRLVGPFLGLLRTNFVLLKGDDETRVIGEFNRTLTLLDRYVLDLAADETEHLDKRVALAVGVMLDTGERR